LQPRRGHAGQKSGQLRSEPAFHRFDRYRCPVNISGSRLPDVLPISISRRLPEGQSGPFGSMISGNPDRVITNGVVRRRYPERRRHPDCRQTVRTLRSVLPRSPFLDNFRVDDDSPRTASFATHNSVFRELILTNRPPAAASCGEVTASLRDSSAVAQPETEWVGRG
jgi:hypothetical protein